MTSRARQASARPIVLLALFFTVALSAAEAELKEVIASGTGATQEEANRNALWNAVEQAVGVLLDAKTVVENEKVIQERILTASNGFVEGSPEILSETQVGKGWRVRVKAKVRTGQLTKKLKENNITTKVEGKGLFAEAITKLEGERRALDMIAAKMQGFPNNVVDVGVVGKPDIGQKTDQAAEIVLTLRATINKEKFNTFRDGLKSALDVLAKQKSTVERTNREFQPQNRKEGTNRSNTDINLDRMVQSSIDDNYTKTCLFKPGSSLTWIVQTNDDQQYAKASEGNIDAIEVFLYKGGDKNGTRMTFDRYILDADCAHALLDQAYAANRIQVNYLDLNHDTLFSDTIEAYGEFSKSCYVYVHPMTAWPSVRGYTMTFVQSIESWGDENPVAKNGSFKQRKMEGARVIIMPFFGWTSNYGGWNGMGVVSSVDIRHTSKFPYDDLKKVQEVHCRLETPNPLPVPEGMSIPDNNTPAIKSSTPPDSKKAVPQSGGAKAKSILSMARNYLKLQMAADYTGPNRAAEYAKKVISEFPNTIEADDAEAILKLAK